MVYLAGGALWLLTVLVLARLLRVHRGAATEKPRVRWRLAWIVALAAGAVLFFRPHEFILGGQDPGAYVNPAASYARHGSIFFTDDMLARVPVEARKGFFFGHRGFGMSKDACLRVVNLETAKLGPEFQPLYPLAMGLLHKAGWPRLMLYVVPFFALCAAFALATLARLTLRQNGADLLAFLFYVLTPLVVWHARAPRPEFIASFLTLGGIALLLHAWEKPGNALDILLGAACLALAPFLHVTASFILIPATALCALAVVRGRPAFILQPVLALGGATGFAWESLAITDHYGVGRFARALMPHWLALAAAVAAGFVALLIMSGVWRRVKRSARWQSMFGPLSITGAVFPGILRLAFAIFASALYVWLYHRMQPVHARAFTGPECYYVSPTDMRVVVEFLSLPVCALALVGLLTMILRGGVQLPVVLCIMPATWSVGVMNDFFTTRYMMTSIAPLTALGLASLVSALPRKGLRRVVPLWLAAAICVLLLAGRTNMVRIREYRGLTSYLERYARKVKAADGMLLCEYPRLGAPIEHIFGVPTLSLDNETRFDYSHSMQAWADIMGGEPGRPAFFVTPYGVPLSDRFSFQPVFTDTLNYQRLPAERFRLPGGLTTGVVSLTLYSMSTTHGEAQPMPYFRAMDQGNMGLRNFWRCHEKDWQIDGIPTGPGKAAPLILRPQGAQPGPARALFFFLDPHPGPPGPSPAVAKEGSVNPPDREKWFALSDCWWLLQAEWSADGAADVCRIATSRELLLTDASLDVGTGENGLRPAAPPGDTPRGSAESHLIGKWCRNPSGFLAPMPPSGVAAYVALLVRASKEASAADVDVEVDGPGIERTTRRIGAGLWTWQVWKVAAGGTRATPLWFRLRTSPSWDPKRSNWPADLGVLVGGIAVFTAPE